MRHPLKAVLVTVISVIAALFALATPAYAKTIHVHPGQSIQAAVDKANPGDTIIVEPGTYQELVEIQTDGIHLRGSGASPDGTVLEPPAGNKTNDCSMGDPSANNGICVVGSFQGGAPVKDVTVSGIMVQNFPSIGPLQPDNSVTVYLNGAATTTFSVNYYAVHIANGAWSGRFPCPTPTATCLLPATMCTPFACSCL